jgi:tripartite-type tricarboxylate transporter receptor subunit TctC
MNLHSRYVHRFIASLLLCAAVGSVVAQNYPTRAVRLVVPFPAGAGVNDILARLVAQKLTDSLGQQIVVDNRPGASGIIGTDIVAKAQPDGYTMLIMSVSFASNPSLYKKLPYDTEKDLAPVTLISSGPLVLVVHPSVPAKSVKELIAYAKTNPGKLNFGSGGPGSTPHFAGELLKLMAGIDMVHVPYKGGAPALADLVGGQIQLILESVPGTLPLIRAEKLRGLAVTSKIRSALAPDLPTLDEAGVQGYEIAGWNGIFVPAKTPAPIIQKLYSEIAMALAQPEVKERLATMGVQAVGNTPAEFAVFIKAETAKWAKLVKVANIRID